MWLASCGRATQVIHLPMSCAPRNNPVSTQHHAAGPPSFFDTLNRLDNLHCPLIETFLRLFSRLWLNISIRHICLKYIPSFFLLSFIFPQKLGIELQIFRQVTRFLFDQALARKFIALHFLLDLPIRQVLSRFITDFNAKLQFKVEEKVGKIRTKLGAEKSNTHLFQTKHLLGPATNINLCSLFCS